MLAEYPDTYANEYDSSQSRFASWEH